LSENNLGLIPNDVVCLYRIVVHINIKQIAMFHYIFILPDFCKLSYSGEIVSTGG
jgi:hypothetical protein